MQTRKTSVVTAKSNQHKDLDGNFIHSYYRRRKSSEHETSYPLSTRDIFVTKRDTQADFYDHEIVEPK